MINRVAITIAGAVSLGTFEAGALFELLDAFEKHNSICNQVVPQSDPKGVHPIKIDVLSGASAGAMSCAIAANKLLYQADSIRGPDDNPLYDAWVNQAHILAMLPSDDPSHSLLSSKYIQSIADGHIINRYINGDIPASDAPAPASRICRHEAVANPLSLGFALSNLTGMEYSVSMRLNQTFSYCNFQDSFKREGIGDAHDNLEFWQEVSAACVASGAFPFAFRVKELPHTAESHISRGNSEPVLPPADKLFAFTDGGLFQNEPLGLSIDLAATIDAMPGNEADSRFYIYIAPGPKSSAAGKPFQAADATYIHLARRLMECIFDQARFQDWIKAERINNKIETFARLMATLAQNHSHIALANTSSSGGEEHLSASGHKQLLNMLALQIKALSQAEIPAFLQLAETMARSFGLVNNDGSIKTHLTIYGVTAENKKLRGSGFCAFEGFLSRKFREHDYAVGRLQARQLLRQLAPGRSREPLVVFDTRPNDDGDLIEIINSCSDSLLLAQGQVIVADLHSAAGKIESMLAHGFDEMLIRGLLEKLRAEIGVEIKQRTV